MLSRLIGATFLVAGTSIGAGMLALPLTTASLGFLNSLFIMIGMWFFMLISAFIMVEISNGKGKSISALSDEKLGKWAKHFAGLSLLTLFWSLLAAYISGGTSLLQNHTSISPFWISVIFTIVLGMFIPICTQLVDYTNRILFFGKVFVLFLIIFGLFPFTKGELLLNFPTFESSSFLAALPIIFTSFGFHGSIPSLINYLQGNRKNIYIALIAGSFIPLIVYIIWLIITLGITGNSIHTQDVGVYIQNLTLLTGNKNLTLLTNLFALLAISTSFIGVALGLFDYIREWFLNQNCIKTRVLSTFLTFLVPLIFSLYYPQGFVFILGFAAISLCALAILLPSFIAITENSTKCILRFPIVIFMILCGFFLVFCEIYCKF